MVDINDRMHTYSFSFTPELVGHDPHGILVSRVGIERKKRQYRHSNPSRMKRRKRKKTVTTLTEYWEKWKKFRLVVRLLDTDWERRRNLRIGL